MKQVPKVNSPRWRNALLKKRKCELMVLAGVTVRGLTKSKLVTIIAEKKLGIYKGESYIQYTIDFK